MNQLLTDKKILISAGGTGGHVYPAIAVANKLRKYGASVEWIGTAAGIESRLVPADGIELHTIFVQGVRGNGIARLIKAPLTILSAVLQARKVIKKSTPDIFVGFGGFASGPGALAAKTFGIPVVIHEQNAAMGLTNKIVSKWAKKILLAFPIVKSKGEVVGNPIRQSITDIAEPENRIRLAKPFRILVVGGSLGAKAINDIVPESLTPLLPNIELTHQTGKKTYDQVCDQYQSLGVAEKVTVCEYIDNIEEAYANTDLVIARAGALTVSEIASVGLPAIFIPLPHAVDNHQFLNAEFLASEGAAIIIEQKELTKDTLKKEVTKLLDNDVLLTMANNAYKQSHEKALATIVHKITEVMHDN
ncbi:MAG: undecaprenyldiphospho-muramoylpentapeptide beta-N-acetylglucosaminyltransferase [Gammaproteobacteria bacterium]|nr:undecaprenyldiphospho-muramoylpentapeptide beta-N-acetylglucosaminyltransferase [Gammaproteobacteria bacterium]